MAIIPLRQYNREIDGLIDTAQLDEAVAHCRHILETFPKHLATYRLLGKAYLEQQRYGDAADIFQRVLSSIPDDHVANIGLSIIREDEGNLDAAIWYMERSLESQPSNTAIKDELRRLYGRRDGIEPPKVRLTRGALARMYARGGLFDQAIGELRAALADDPQRPDLLVLLAQMYFNLGQQVEAVDTCGNLIKKLPYCLVANRILSTILPQTGRAEDTKTYHHRVIAMDPYFATAAANTLTADAVPEAAITIERLTYRPDQGLGGPAQPAWAASLGIAFEETPGDQLPEWLQDQNIPEPKADKDAFSAPATPFSWETAPDDVAAEAGQPISAEDIIPDWMKEAGWQPATGAASEEAFPAVVETPSSETEGDLAKADLPDWLKNLAPANLVGEQPPEELGELNEAELPWLQEATPGASDTIVNWLGAQKPTGEAAQSPVELPTPETLPEPVNLPKPPASEKGETGGLPDWLRGVEESYEKSGITDWLKSSHTGEYESAPPSPEAHTTPTEEVPDWLKEIGETAPETVASAAELPGWLSEMRESEAEFTSPEAEDTPVPAEEIPDWLKGIGDTTAEPAAPADELPDWLKQMGTPEAETTSTEVASPGQEIPDWLKELEQPETAPAPFVPAEAEPARIAEEPPAIMQLTGVEPALPADEIPDWLKEMTEPAVELASYEPAADAPALPAVDIPDWLKEIDDLAAEPVLELPDDISKQTGENGEPATELEIPQAESEQVELPVGDIPYWLMETTDLSSVDAGTLPGEPVAAVPATPDIELPEWLSELGQPSDLEGNTPPSTSGNEGEQTPVEEQPAVPAEELPDWLKEMNAPIAESTAPFTSQSDQDAALAWLEALAAQHGASEEELITKPEERLEAMPEWIKAESEEAQVPESAVSAAGEFDISDQDSALAWLETLAAKQGAKEEELITRPEERLDSMPEWIKHEAEESQSEPLTVQPAITEETVTPVEEVPDWQKEIAETADDSTPAQPETEAPPAEQEEYPDWLAETVVAAETVAQHEPQAEIEELPDWLKETVAAPSEEAGEKPEAAIEELPDWLKATETPSAPPWMPEAILPEAERPTLEPVTPAPAILEDTGITLPAPEAMETEAETEDMIFARARQAIDHGEVVPAAQLYNQLVAQKADMEQVIADMQVALYRYPVDINFWQILGDAYLRTDKLQEALDAYTKAEELLR